MQSIPKNCFLQVSAAAITDIMQASVILKFEFYHVSALQKEPFCDKMYLKKIFNHHVVHYLKTRAGSLSCALSWSTSFVKLFKIKPVPDEGIPISLHSISIEACLSTQIAFNDWMTDSTWRRQKTKQNKTKQKINRNKEGFVVLLKRSNPIL